MSEVKLRIAPNSKESEMMVLGCMLTSINSLNIASDGLSDSDFYYNEHKVIFQALKTAYMMEKPADVHLICEELKREDKLRLVGGAAYITVLAQYAGTSAYIEEYVELVKHKAILRRMIDAAQGVEKNALEEPKDVLATLDNAQQLFFQSARPPTQRQAYWSGEIFSGVKAESKTPFLKELQERQERFQQKGPEDIGITGMRPISWTWTR